MDIPVNPFEKFVIIILIIVLTTIIVRIIAWSLNKFSRFKNNMTSIHLIRDIITYAVYFIALMIILQLFGIDLYTTLLSLGILGIALSLAAKDLLSNFFSGIILIIGKSVKVGDTLEINGKKGIVERISLRTTTLTDDNGIKNQVPNSTLTNNPYLQFKDPEKYRADLIVGIPLNIDIENFKKYIVEKIESYDGIEKTPKANVYFKGMTFEETQLKVSFWVKDFNSKDDYKLIITNYIRKYIQMGEKNE